MTISHLTKQQIWHAMLAWRHHCILFQALLVSSTWNDAVIFSDNTRRKPFYRARAVVTFDRVLNDLDSKTQPHSPATERGSFLEESK